MSPSRIAVFSLLFLTSFPLMAQTPASTTTVPRTQGAVGGDLLVAPTRIILEGSRRSAEVTLINTGSVTAVYRIGWKQLVMSEDGALKEVEAENAVFRADQLIRFSPRQVELQPGAAQTVRLALRKPAGLARGEYRSHLHFRAVPSADQLGAKVEEQAANGIQIQLIPVYGVTIPVIVRHDTSASEASIVSAAIESLQDASSVARVTLSRDGDESVYGNMVVTAADGRIVGSLNGFAVYPPSKRREIRVPLSSDFVGKAGEKLRLQFVTTTAAGGERVLAETHLQIPGDRQSESVTEKPPAS